MQVTHVQDHVTHAVIGPNAAQSFGISDSAEFFNILSNTLYSDKPLAVGREVLCNAWDSHIASGRTHIPLELFLDSQVLRIRDHGTGIPKHLMHSIYCVYGNSTKTNDGEQTGGFGLGCKSPFAYTDHFEVANHHAGMKTIYRISKSSAQAKGKPGIEQIMTLPTAETGIEVSIELKDPRDVAKFREVILRIVAAGEMNATLNGVQLETLPFSEAKNGYLITRKDIVANSHRRIYVRYGNVIYPLEHNNAYSEEYNRTTKLLEKMTSSAYGGIWRLVLQAQPHSISVTPSRESLSLTDQTIANLKQLLVDFLAVSSARMDSEATRINQDCIAQTFLDLKPVKVLDTSQRIVGLTPDRAQAKAVMTDIADVTRNIVSAHYPATKAFRSADIELRLRSLIASGFGNRGKIQAFLKDWTNPQFNIDSSSHWFHRHLVGPLVTKMSLNKDLSAVRLMVYGRNRAGRQQRYYQPDCEFTEATKYRKTLLDEYLPFLRNVIVLSYNRADVTERAPNFPAMLHWFGDVEESLVYVVQRSAPKVEAARAFFEQQGFTIIDLTKRQKWEPEAATQPKETRVWTPRKKGIPVLSSLLPKGNVYISTLLAREDDVERTETPEFVVKIGDRSNSDRFGGFDHYASRDIVTLFGTKGGIVVNETQATKFKAAGARPMLDWLYDVVVAELKSNTRIQKYQAVDIKRLGIPYYEDHLTKALEVIMKDDALRAHYNLGHQLTSEDRRYIRIWEALAEQLKWSRKADVEATQKFLKSFPVSEELTTLKETMQKSPLFTMIRVDNLSAVLNKTETTSTINMQKAKARDILIYAIAG